MKLENVINRRVSFVMNRPTKTEKVAIGLNIPNFTTDMREIHNLRGKPLISAFVIAICLCRMSHVFI